MPRLRFTGPTGWIALAVLTTSLLGAAGARAGTEGGGGHIAFLRFAAGVGTSRASLFVIRADGTGLRRLTAAGSRVYAHTWSPDGTRIAYTNGGSLWLVRPDGSGRVRLVSRSSLNVLSATWSPNGRAIAVLAQDPTKKPPWASRNRIAEIYVVPTGGGAPQSLQTGDVRDPSWSPQSDEIAYATPRGEIRTMRSDGSSSSSIVATQGSASCGRPAWSADGQRLAVACGDSRGRYAYIDAVYADGSGLRRLTRHANNEFGFAWSPDGAEILYGKENSKGIYVIGADGRNDRRLTSDAPARIAWGALTWAPDGRSIAYATDRTGSGDLYLIGADGRNKLRLTSSAESDIEPSWAPG